MAFLSGFIQKFGNEVTFRSFKISSKFVISSVFALLGLASSFYFLVSCWSDEGGIFGAFGGISFLLCFGIFSYKIYIHGRNGLFLHVFLYWISFFVGALYWLIHPLTLNLATHGVLIPFALLAIPAYLSIPLLIPVYIAKRFCKNIWSFVFIFSLFTFSIMYLQGHYAPGFPWVLPGYVWSENICMIQALSVWGIYGQTFFTLLLGSILGAGGYWFRKSFKKCFWSIFVVLCSLLSLYVFGFVRTSKNFGEFTNHKVRCVQGSILQENKMNRNLSIQNLNLYLNLSKMTSDHENWRPDFVIWPEASVPYLFTEESVVLRQKLAGVIPNNGYLLVGVVRKDSSNGAIYNSLAVLDQFGTNVVNYDKKRLVPFGEYIPFRRFIPKVFAPIANSIGDFDVGKSSNIVELKGLKIAFTICYEAIFPGEFVAKNVDAMVNVTNDAWFGHTSEPVQHLNIVRARAIEVGIPVIRVTNFGISAVFDAYGREVKSLKTDEIGVIDCYIPKKAEKTLYRKFFVD